MPGSDSAIRLQFIKETQIGIANTKLSEVYYFVGATHTIWEEAFILELANYVVHARCGFMFVCLRTTRGT